MTKVERRGAVRIPARLAMEIVVGGDSTRVRSLNVSANGVYFSSPVFIEPLTRLRITLELPTEEGDDGRTNPVACDGVVVRTEPEAAEPGVTDYQVACYFTDIPAREGKMLEAYVFGHVPFRSID